MPTYDYECRDCGHRFEAFQTMTAKPLRKCPSCGKRRVKRLIGSGLAPIFKGSGFYQTDYKAKPAESQPSEATTTEAPKATDQAKPEPDSKPAKKPEAEPAKKPAKK